MFRLSYFRFLLFFSLPHIIFPLRPFCCQDKLLHDQLLDYCVVFVFLFCACFVLVAAICRFLHIPHPRPRPLSSPQS